MRRARTVLLAALGALGARALAAPPLTDTRPGLREALVQADTMIPARRLGVRAALVKRARLVSPDVVIVEDAASYLDAIGAWTPGRIFPVLWDDGSARAQEDIARFVRAFEPRRVLRYASDAPQPTPASRSEAIYRAWAAAAGLDGPGEPAGDAARVRETTGVTPPGLVVASGTDRAWPAALALAAGRLQPLLLIEKPRGSVSAALSPAEGDAIASDIERFAQWTTLSWNELGDDLDAITLCLDGPIQIKTGDSPRTLVALSDRLGRLGASGAGARWAWCGQILGDQARSVYCAMSALFLQADRAWLFDTYPPTGEWSAFDASEAGRLLERGGMEAVVHDAPRNRRADWRLATLRPLDAGLVLVNTKGVPDYFEFEGARGGAGDLPLLGKPAIVYFVHSFSLARPGDRGSIGARWLERGAYAYLGSVQEPYLQSFVPTPALAARFASGFAWGAATRVDSGPVWKLAVLGDPLTTLSPPGVRDEGEAPLDDAEPIDAGLSQQLRDGDFEGAARTLTLLGRDADVARLIRGLLKDRPELVTPGLCERAIPPLTRTGERALTLRLARTIPDLARAPIAHDHAWVCARAMIALEQGRDEAISFMRTNVRASQLVRDAEEVGLALKPVSGGAGASAFVASLVSRAPNARVRESLQRLAREFASGKR